MENDSILWQVNDVLARKDVVSVAVAEDTFLYSASRDEDSSVVGTEKLENVDFVLFFQTEVSVVIEVLNRK